MVAGLPRKATGFHRVQTARPSGNLVIVSRRYTAIDELFLRGITPFYY
jgi:hypothetical protein